MYWIFIETDCEASHQLTMADGTKEPLHSHRWHITAAVCAAKLNAEGLVMDFHDLQRIVHHAVDPFSGKPLETFPAFAGRNASAEALARCLFDAVAPSIPPPACLGYIEVTEAPGCRARYRPEP